MEKEPDIGMDNLTEYQQKGLELSKRLNEAEAAFQEASDILSNLDRQENKGRLSKSFEWYYQINPNLFDNAEFMPLKDETLKKEFGVSFFPLDVAISNQRWNALLSKLRYDHSAVGFYAGRHYFDKSPFDKIGLGLWNEDYIKKEGITSHEDMHRVYELYKPFKSSMETEGPVDDYPRSSQRSLINEINACRTNVKEEKEWGFVWGIIEHKFQEEAEPWQLSPETEARMYDRIEKAHKTLPYLERYLSEAVITHILINCESFDDLNAWGQLNPEYLKKLAGKENNVKL